MKHRLTVILTLLAVFSLLFGCRARTSGVGSDTTTPLLNPPVQLPANLDSFPQISARNPNVEADYEPIAENDILRLYLKKASSAIIVEDKRNGFLWRSSPADLSTNKDTTNSWKRQIESPVQISFVDSDRSQPKNIKPEQGVLAFQPVQGGVKTTFSYPDSALSFEVVFSIQDDSLQVTIPDASIVQSGSNGLVGVDILAFLGATHTTDNGYIVYPDGSGAIMYFNTPFAKEVQKMTNIVYGADASGGGISGVFRKQIVMPVFGMVNGEAGFVGIITNGDFDANIAMGRSGKGLNYHHVWGSFTFRRQGRFSLTGGQPAWLYEPNLIKGNRSIRYSFLTGKEASYVGMGVRYRDFLINERGAKRISGTPPLMNLLIFMGIERKTWFLADMVLTTTFAQAQDILNNLDNEGVKQIDISLWYWNQGATSSRYPQRLPVDARLGGEAGLRALIDDIHRRGQKVYLQDEYLYIPPGAKGIFPFLDAVRGVDGLPIGSGDSGYLLNPQVALRRFFERDSPKIVQFGADGLDLNNFAFVTLPDKNSVYPLSRENFAATWMEIAKRAKATYGSVAMTGSNSYAVPYTDRLDFVLVDSTHYDLFDDSIPLLQIAIHGLVPYAGDTFNLLSDSSRMFLRHLEYGTIPSFDLTYESSSLLYRTMANSIFSSRYDFWKPEIIRQYKVMESIAPLVSQFITGHERLVENVYQTTYEDGTRIIVNYGTGIYTSGTINVGPQDYLVVPGD